MASRTTRPDDVTSSTNGRTVVGLFTDRSEAEGAIRDLKDAGFTEREIGAAMRNRNEQQELVGDTGSAAAVGAVSGGLVGGVIGLLGSLLIPGVGPVVAGGVLASVLTGAGIGAAAGGIIGALTGLGVPEADARHFDRGLRSGGVLVTVDAADRILDALDILERHDADLGPSNAERFRTTVERQSFEVPVSREKARIDTGGDASVRHTEGRSSKPYKGKDRRRRADASYGGPERRELFL